MELERIAKALERIADAMEKQPAPAPASKPKPTPEPSSGRLVRTKVIDGKEVHALIKAYIDAFRSRYGMKARPDVGGRVQGLMKTLLRDHPVARLTALIQAYCQMEDAWFKTKCHDFVSFYENLGKVQTALLNGTGRAEDKSYWDKVFGGSNGEGSIPKTDRALASDVRGEVLPSRAGVPLLASARENV